MIETARPKGKSYSMELFDWVTFLLRRGTMDQEQDWSVHALQPGQICLSVWSVHSLEPGQICLSVW